MQDHASDLQAVLRALALETREFLVVGSSTGSNIVIEHLVRGGRTPAALALMLPMRRYVFPLWGVPFLYLPHRLFSILKPAIKLHLRLFESDRSADRSMLTRNYYSLERLEPARAQLSARALRRYRFPGELQRLSMPTLIAGAKLDRMHEPGLAQELARRLPQGRALDMGVSGMAHTRWMGRQILEFFRTCSSGQGETPLGGSGNV
jgi:pimeloyl-ACP methyl ester carboxylesterase